jgi:hypothetical protein
MMFFRVACPVIGHMLAGISGFLVGLLVGWILF